MCAKKRKYEFTFKMGVSGGKIENGETEKDALIREIKEEMKCDLIVGDKVTTTTYEYDFGIVNLTTYKCELNNKNQL